MTVFAAFISWGKLFQALIVEGKKELKKRLVRARIDCISFAFLRLYGVTIANKWRHKIRQVIRGE